MGMKQAVTQYLMVILLVVGAYFLGVYKTKTEFLEKGATNTVAQAGQGAQQPTKPASVDLEQIRGKFDGKHITFGDKAASLIITEVSDPSCPFCHMAAGLNKELSNGSTQFKLVADGGTYVAPVQEIKKLIDAGKASFLFIYANGHGNGEVATQALYCAYEQNKFWEAHDIFMSSQGYNLINNTVKNDMSKSSQLVALVNKVLDGKKLQACLDKGTFAKQPGEDQAFVQSLGFGATPTFFVNDKVVEGAQPWSAFESLL
jgi:protein-disulfide isomerase